MDRLSRPRPQKPPSNTSTVHPREYLHPTARVFEWDSMCLIVSKQPRSSNAARQQTSAQTPTPTPTFHWFSPLPFLSNLFFDQLSGAFDYCSERSSASFLEFPRWDTEEKGSRIEIDLLPNEPLPLKVPVLEISPRAAFLRNQPKSLQDRRPQCQDQKYLATKPKDGHHHSEIRREPTVHVRYLLGSIDEVPMDSKVRRPKA